MLARTLAVLVAALALLVAPGCGENITREAYDQIEDGMDMLQVEDILGGPGEIQSAAGVGIGAGGLTEMQKDDGDIKTYLWGDENVGIVVKFKDGKVYHKSPLGI